MELVIVSDHTDQCYSNCDGEKIYSILYSKLKDDVKVNLSFKGVQSVTSSFVNSALIELLEDFDFDFLRQHLSFSNTSGQINSLINQRFKFEVKKRMNLVNV